MCCCKVVCSIFDLILCTTYVRIGSKIHSVSTQLSTGFKWKRIKLQTLLCTDSTHGTQLFDKPQKLEILVCYAIDFLYTLCTVRDAVSSYMAQKAKYRKRHTQNCLMFKYTWLKWWMFYTLCWSLFRFQLIHSILQYFLLLSVLLVVLFISRNIFHFIFYWCRCCCAEFFSIFFSSSFCLWQLKFSYIFYDFSLLFLCFFFFGIHLIHNVHLDYKNFKIASQKKYDDGIVKHPLILLCRILVYEQWTDNTRTWHEIFTFARKILYRNKIQSNI